MKNNTQIAVTSRSFSRHPILRKELQERYSNVRFNDDGVVLRERDLVEYAQGCKKLITALEPIDEKFLSAVPELEVISKYGVGLDMLDTTAMAQHKVRLGWTGGVNKRSVSELVIALSIALLREVMQSNRELCDEVWKNRVGRCLTGRTVGIIGCGHIGKDLTRILRCFECQVLQANWQNHCMEN